MNKELDSLMIRTEKREIVPIVLSTFSGIGIIVVNRKNIMGDT